MTDPKTFFRELDALLATIRIESPSTNLLPFVIKILESNFGAQLKFRRGCLYELRAQDFVLVYPENKKLHWAEKIPRDAAAIRLAWKHRSYVYDNDELNHTFLADPASPAGYSTAIWVHNQEKQWVLVFELMDGWMREEITLLLNAVRMSLNYRLFTDIIGGSLQQAVEIQKSLLPKNSINVAGYDIYGHSQPAELVGGDFYDYHDYEDGTFGVSIGDASGHGIPAALLVRDVVIGLRMGLAKEHRLVHSLEKLNQVIQRSTYSTNFVSLFIGEFEEDGHIFYVNAGHPAPFLFTHDSIHEAPATGITLGFMENIKLARSHIHMPPGSALVMFTDGIVERGPDPDYQFGHKRLKELIFKHRFESAQNICDLIFSAVYRYDNQVPWEDDATVVVVKRSLE